MKLYGSLPMACAIPTQLVHHRGTEFTQEEKP